MARRPVVSAPTYRRIALVALCSQVLIMVTGAAVRLTSSGLGCADWPSCEEDRFIPTMDGHALIEFFNRSLSSVVLIAVVAAVLGAHWRRPYRRDLYWWSLGPLAGVVAQIVLGGVVVNLELAPVSVIGHFLLSIVLVWSSTVLYERAGREPGRLEPAVGTGVAWVSRAMVVLSLGSIVTGTLVTATGPHGGDEVADRLGWFDIREIAQVHGAFGLTLLATTLALLWLARHRYRPGGTMGSSRPAMLAIVLVAQLCVGYAQYALGLPPLLVGIHVLGSALVWIAILRFHMGLFEVAAREPSSADPRPHSPANHEGVGVGRL